MKHRILLVVFLASTACTMLASERYISGKVTDAGGEPLTGAYVSAKGSRDVVTITDKDGSYKLHLPDDLSTQLQVTYVGFVPKTVTITPTSQNLHYNFRLEEDMASLEQVVVTATMTPKSLKDVPVVTRVITLGDIQKVDATNVQDMLTQELPGLEFGFAMNQETSLNMSGFGGNAVLFLVDGERLAGETMENTDYNRLNLDNVGRVEIVKGASSALYGSNAVGGVVNVISRESSQPWTANVNSRYSELGNEWRNGINFSFNHGRWNSQTNFQQTKIDPIKLSSGPTSEEVALYELMGVPYEKDKSNIKQLYGQETYNVKERLTYKASENLKLVARGGYFYRESNRSTYDYHFNAYSGGLKGIYDWKGGKSMELSYAYDQYDKANYQPDGTRTHDHDYTNRQHVGHLIYNQQIARKHTMTLGADYLNDYLSTYQFIDNAAHQQSNVDAFAQLDYNPTKHINLVGSLRYDYFSASGSQSLTARLAAMYKWQATSIRASYAGGFRAPSLKEMYMHYDMGNMGYIIVGNPDVDPEKSDNFNLTLERNSRLHNGNLFDGMHNVTVMGYCNIFDNRITNVGRYWVVDSNHEEGGFQVLVDDNHIEEYEENGETQYRYVADDGKVYKAQTSSLYWNEEGVTVCGLDVSTQYRLDFGLGLKLNYAYMHESGNVVASQFTQPRSHSMTWRLDYDRQIHRHYGFNLALSGRWLGKPQSGRTDVDQGYTLWKAMLQQRIYSGINLNLTIDNLLNYIPDAYYYCSPMTLGRTWSLGLSVDIERFFEK